MNRIDVVFDKLKKEKKKAVIPYISCGYPDIDFSEKLIYALAESGADMIELGVPFSDPVADGPSIQNASMIALKNGINLEKIFSLALKVREKTDTPLVMMTYYNLVYARGIKRFIDEAAKAGIDGLIIPDLPIDEAGSLMEEAGKKDIEVIFLIAPNTPESRIKVITEKAKGFIYCVSVTGTTGSREKVNESLGDFIERMRANTDLPLAVGFGISSPIIARELANLADGVIVGSALIDKMEQFIIDKNTNYPAAIEAAVAFIREFKQD